MEEFKKLKVGPVEFVINVPLDKKGNLIFDQNVINEILLKTEEYEKNGIVKEATVQGYVDENGKIRVSAKSIRQAIFGLSEKEKLAPHGLITEVFPYEDKDDYGRPLSYYYENPENQAIIAENKIRFKKESERKKEWDRFFQSEEMAMRKEKEAQEKANLEKYKALKQSIFHMFLEATMKVTEYNIDNPDIISGYNSHLKQLFAASVLEKYRPELTNIINNLSGTNSFAEMCKLKNGDVWINPNSQELEKLLAMGSALGLIDVLKNTNNQPNDEPTSPSL